MEALILSVVTSIITLILAPIVAAWIVRDKYQAEVGTEQATQADMLVNTAIALVQALQLQLAEVPELKKKAEQLEDCKEELEAAKAELNYWQKQARNKVDGEQSSISRGGKDEE